MPRIFEIAGLILALNALKKIPLRGVCRPSIVTPYHARTCQAPKKPLPVNLHTDCLCGFSRRYGQELVFCPGQLCGLWLCKSVETVVQSLLQYGTNDWQVLVHFLVNIRLQLDSGLQGHMFVEARKKLLMAFFSIVVLFSLLHHSV